MTDRDSQIFGNSECLSLEVMQQYVRGELSAKEDREVEQHLVDCPICSDAAEGLEEHKDSQGFAQRVQRINQRVDQQIGGPKQRQLTMPVKRIVAVIALLLLVGGGLYIGMQYIPHTPQLAQQSKEKKSKQKTVPPDQQNDQSQQKTPLDNRTGYFLGQLTDSLSDTTPVEARQPLAQTMKKTKDTSPQYLADASADRQRGAASSGSDVAEEQDSLQQPIALLEKKEPEDSEAAPAELKEEESLGEDKSRKEAAQTSYRRDEGAARKAPPAKSKSQREYIEARYPGGDTALERYIHEHQQYPEKARQQQVEGTVQVRFEVTAQGETQEVEVIDGVHSSLDEEAVRLIENMPPWEPATRAGEAVRDTITLPVPFMLEE